MTITWAARLAATIVAFTAANSAHFHFTDNSVLQNESFSLKGIEECSLVTYIKAFNVQAVAGR